MTAGVTAGDPQGAACTPMVTGMPTPPRQSAFSTLTGYGSFSIVAGVPNAFATLDFSA
jgi:hypothetical protein